MQLAGRLSAAIDILSDIEQLNLSIASALSLWGTKHRFAGVRDRSAIGNIVYDAFRYRSLIAWNMGGKDSPLHLGYGALLLQEKITATKLCANIADDKFLTHKLSQEDMLEWDNNINKTAPDNVRANVQNWLEDILQNTFGDEWVEEAAELCHRPPMDLRVNSLKATPQKVIQSLKGGEALEFSAQTVRFPPISGSSRHPNVKNDQAFLKGWFEIQDLGSQLVTQLLPIEGNEQILDYCAGAGGKSLAISALSKNKGQIYAYDLDKNRLAPIYDRIKRAGCRNIQVSQYEEQLDKLKGKIDIMLLDVPCTGTGTWRRRPEIKWKLTQSQLQEVIKKQEAILNKSIEYLKDKDSYIAYVTCSILEQENNMQIKNFLANNPQFKAVDLSEAWAKLKAPADMEPLFSDEGILLTPKRTSSDGFFLSVLTYR